MKLVTETVVRFVTKPIAYLCHVFDPDRHPGWYEFQPEKRHTHSVIRAVSSDLDKYTLPEHGRDLAIRHRILGFNCETQQPVIFDFGKGFHFIKPLLEDEYYYDIRKYDMCFKFEPYGPGYRWYVTPKFPKPNKESEKFAYDREISLRTRVLVDLNSI